MSVESNYVGQLNPPGDRFSDPSGNYGGDVPGSTMAEPLMSDCNDGATPDWGNVVLNTATDYAQSFSPDDAFTTLTVTDNAGSGVCDMPETEACASVCVSGGGVHRRDLYA